MTKTCLDLFAGLGGFSAAFEESSNWEVTTVEIDDQFDPDICADVLDLRPADLPDPDVVLASPPCTVFSTAGNHDAWDFETHEPQTERAREHVTLAFHTLGLVEALSPEYWFLENPRGRLRWFFGEPTGTVTYCQYGEDYQKPTDLWGHHPAGFTYKSCPRGGNCHSSNTEDDGYSAIQAMPSDHGERAKVPYELSLAIREAVEATDQQPNLQQETLTGYVATDGGEWR